MSTQSLPPRPEEAAKDHYAYLWLLLASGSHLLYTGRWKVSIATWLGVVFMLRFVEKQPLLKGWLLLSTGLFFPALLANQGMFLQPAGQFIITLFIGTFLGTLPFLLYRWQLTYHQDRSFLSTLFFPCTIVAFDYINVHTNPFGSWGSLVYTQMDFPILLQWTSVLGIWGISFLIAWFGSVVCWAWHHHFRWPHIRKGLVLFGVSTAIILLYGSLRLEFSVPRGKYIRVAGIVSPLGQNAWDLFKDNLFKRQQLTKAEEKLIFAKISAIHQTAFDRSRQAAKGGAKIILWSEAMGVTDKGSESTFLQQAKALAKRYKVYLAVSYWLLLHKNWKQMSTRKLIENKLVLLTPQGIVGWSYSKWKPLPGIEQAITKPGEQQIPALLTPYGRLGGAICFDLDFPQHIKRAGKKEIDIFLAPAGDWPAVAKQHAQMSSLRALENGFSLLRVTNNGHSVAFDGQGRLLAKMNHLRTRHPIFYADVPSKRMFTFYGYVGDVFAWCCIVVFLFTILYKLFGYFLTTRSVKPIQQLSMWFALLLVVDFCWMDHWLFYSLYLVPEWWM